MAYDSVRLENDGVVVAYLAPNFQVDSVVKNDVLTFTVPGQTTRAFDHLTIKKELTVQGTFLDSDDMPADQKAAVEALFGGPATAADQVNRIEYYMRSVGGAFDFYNQDDEYTATTTAGVDIENGVFPQVFITEMRPIIVGGITRRSWVLKFTEAINAVGEQ